MTTLLKKSRCNTTLRRRHAKVVEMWECKWKEVHNESDVTTFLTPSSRPRWTITQQQLLAAVVDGTLFGMVECDVCVPEELQDYFSEMQPVFKNASVTQDDIGPFMRQYAENTTFSRNHASCLWIAFVVSRSCSPRQCYDGTSRTDSWWIQCTESSSMNLSPAFDGLVSRFPQLDVLDMKTPTRPSLTTR